MQMHRFFHVVRKLVDQVENRHAASRLCVFGRIAQIYWIDRRFRAPPPKTLGVPALVDRNATKPETHMLVALESDIRTPKLNENLLVYILGSLTRTHLAIGNSIDVDAESTNRIRHIA